jgi:hypothetical protein
MKVPRLTEVGLEVPVAGKRGKFVTIVPKKGSCVEEGPGGNKTAAARLTSFGIVVKK